LKSLCKKGTAHAVRRKLKEFAFLGNPPYSPDEAASDFYLFPKLKEHLRGQRFSCVEEVKSAVRKWTQKQNTNFLKDGFQN